MGVVCLHAWCQGGSTGWGAGGWPPVRMCSTWAHRALLRNEKRYPVSSPLLRGVDRRALEELLAEAVCFHSPVADHGGSGRRQTPLSLIAAVLSDLRITRYRAVDDLRRRTVQWGWVISNDDVACPDRRSSRIGRDRHRTAHQHARRRRGSGQRRLVRTLHRPAGRAVHDRTGVAGTRSRRCPARASWAAAFGFVARGSAYGSTLRSVGPHRPHRLDCGGRVVPVKRSAKAAATETCCFPALSQSGRRDLNPGPPAPKAGALPSCATPRAWWASLHRGRSPAHVE